MDLFIVLFGGCQSKQMIKSVEYQVFKGLILVPGIRQKHSLFRQKVVSGQDQALECVILAYGLGHVGPGLILDAVVRQIKNLKHSSLK